MGIQIRQAEHLASSSIILSHVVIQTLRCIRTGSGPAALIQKTETSAQEYDQSDDDREGIVVQVSGLEIPRIRSADTQPTALAEPLTSSPSMKNTSPPWSTGTLTELSRAPPAKKRTR